MKRDKVGNTFLHTLAKKNKLKNMFREVGVKESREANDGNKEGPMDQKKDETEDEKKDENIDENKDKTKDETMDETMDENKDKTKDETMDENKNWSEKLNIKDEATKMHREEAKNWSDKLRAVQNKNDGEYNRKFLDLEKFREDIGKLDMKDQVFRMSSDEAKNWFDKLLGIQNKNGYTFLAVAVIIADSGKNDSKENLPNEEDIIETLKRMIRIFGQDVVSQLCAKTDNGGNSLSHLAVRKNMTKLMAFLLPKTTEEHKIFNQNKCNPLHLAVLLKKHEMTTFFSKQRNFNLDERMTNGETALHLAAQLGEATMLGELIEGGGDLAMQDEDGHTPLHDCVQQVYFDSEQEEKYRKFIDIWNVVVDKSVTWWCCTLDIDEPAHGSPEYMDIQRHAVYYLRSCIKNNDGLSVLQFAADRGLVLCAQIMLTTQEIFVIQSRQDKKGGKMEMFYEIDITNLCPEYFVPQRAPMEMAQKSENEKGKGTETEAENENSRGNKSAETTAQKVQLKTEDGDSNNSRRSLRVTQEESREGSEMSSFLEALAEVEPSNKAGEILESIPMISLTKLEWRVSYWMHVLWMITHFILMMLVSIEVSYERSGSSSWSAKSILLGIIILLYSSIVTVLHVIVKIRFGRKKRNKEHSFIEGSIRRYNRNLEDSGILPFITSTPLIIFNESVLILELLFTGFAWAVTVLRFTDFKLREHVWVEGFFLLFGWLMLLIPITSFSPIYKLISVLRNIILKDMLPWMVIYMIITMGFAMAIKLQFVQLPISSPCFDDEADLSGYLHRTGHTLLELITMTSGLDTDLKHVGNLSCLFQYNSRSVFVILLLVIAYAVISALVLLNMLIAIMSNTVTEAQQDKGWRQYQVGHNIFLGSK